MDQNEPLGDVRQREHIGAIYRSESRRVLATLIRLLGNFDLAEEATQEAFVLAAEKWPREGMPSNPRAWLISTGRFKVIDRMRRRSRHDDAMQELAERLEFYDTQEHDDEDIADDRLRLIFTCCHPAIAHDAQVALTLREICGLTTEEIAQAFLTKPSTLAQRIVRAKRRIRDKQIPYEVPSRDEMPDRLDSVLQVIYLVFNEGYSASSGSSLTRPDLSGEAIHLGRMLVDLLPEPEAKGLLGLMLLHESRRNARTSADGELVLLEDQDRSLWNEGQIQEGLKLVDQAFSSGVVGHYTIQAAIAAAHAEAPDASATDWAKIVELYQVLMRASFSPVVELNHAVAMAMRDGPAEGLRLIDSILERGELENYHLAHAARAEMLRRLGKANDARSAYRAALNFVHQEPERRFLEQRLNELAERLD